jgi:methionyl-tRNA formyltransferase
VNLVILCGCGPINTCLINLIARQHPVRHSLRVAWTNYATTKSKMSKLTSAPVRTIQHTLRRRFENWLEKRIESQAVDQLIARGISTSCSAPTTTVDQLTINTKAFAQSLQALETDVLVTAGCPLLKPEIFEVPKIATINIHNGIAPAYRGQRTIFWPLYYRDFDNIGITLHQIDRGVDTGPILARGFPELCPGDNEATIFAKSTVLAADLLCKLLADWKVGPVAGVRQSGGGRNYRTLDDRIWLDASYRFLRAVGRRPIPNRPARVELHYDRQSSSVT